MFNISSEMLSICFKIDTNLPYIAVFVSLSDDNILLLLSRPGTVLTVQALSEDDHKFWMQAMGGKESVSQLPVKRIHHIECFPFYG